MCYKIKTLRKQNLINQAINIYHLIKRLKILMGVVKFVEIKKI